MELNEFLLFRTLSAIAHGRAPQRIPINRLLNSVVRRPSAKQLENNIAPFRLIIISPCLFWLE